MQKSRSPKLLVAEDNPVNRRMTVRMLARMGFDADEAGNGSEAVEKARSGAYDLIFMDVHMPVMGGKEATRQLRESGIDVPVVAMTASVREDDKERCLDAGMTHYVAKPIDLANMTRILHACCGIEVAADAPPAPLQPEPENTAQTSLDSSSENRLCTGADPVVKEGFVGHAAVSLGMDEEEYRDLAEEFIADVEQRYEALHVALKDNDLARARQVAHAIKGGAADMLLADMAAAAARIEASARQEESAGCRDGADALGKALEKFKRIIH